MLCDTYIAHLVSFLSIVCNSSKNAGIVIYLQNCFWQTLIGESGVIIMNLCYRIQFFLNYFKNSSLFQEVNN